MEVPSPSTEKDDRTRKLDFYRRSPSVRAVLLVWQEARRVEVRERDDERSLVRDMIGSGTILLEDLGLHLDLDKIYAD